MNHLPPPPNDKYPIKRGCRRNSSGLVGLVERIVGRVVKGWATDRRLKNEGAECQDCIGVSSRLSPITFIIFMLLHAVLLLAILAAGRLALVTNFALPEELTGHGREIWTM
ncbi:MAG: hypothetical protein LBB40_01120 [Holophagales bacterium]|nr:hypothetical protein [Holophagales bacterium]